jgi:hypothetical protein
MEASSAGKREYGGKGTWVKCWVRLGCWISPFKGPFSLGARFETYEPFISLIFNFFRGALNRGCWISGYGGHDCIYHRLRWNEELIWVLTNSNSFMSICKGLMAAGMSKIEKLDRQFKKGSRATRYSPLSYTLPLMSCPVPSNLRYMGLFRLFNYSTVLEVNLSIPDFVLLYFSSLASQ